MRTAWALENYSISFAHTPVYALFAHFRGIIEVKSDQLVHTLKPVFTQRNAKSRPARGVRTAGVPPALTTAVVNNNQNLSADPHSSTSGIWVCVSAISHAVFPDPPFKVGDLSMHAPHSESN